MFPDAKEDGTPSSIMTWCGMGLALTNGIRNWKPDFKFSWESPKEDLMHDSMQAHDFVWFLIVGGLAGWIASVLVEGGGLGLIGDIVVGIIGGFLGGFFAYQFNIAVYGFWGVLGMSVFGAVILLIILRLFSRSWKTA